MGMSFTQYVVGNIHSMGHMYTDCVYRHIQMHARTQTDKQTHTQTHTHVHTHTHTRNKTDKDKKITHTHTHTHGRTFKWQWRKINVYWAQRGQQKCLFSSLMAQVHKGQYIKNVSWKSYNTTLPAILATSEYTKDESSLKLALSTYINTKEDPIVLRFDVNECQWRWHFKFAYVI